MTLVYVCIAWLAGIYIGRTWSLSVVYLWLAVPLLSAAVWGLRRRRPERFAAVLALVGVLGILRTGAALPHLTPDDAAYYVDQHVDLTGVIVAQPDIRDTKATLTISADTLSSDTGFRAVRGHVLVKALRFPRFQYGDRVQASGYLQEPPVYDDFSYRDYLARQGIYALMSYPKLERLSTGNGSRFFAALEAVRGHAQKTIGQILPDPEAGLLSGILLGTYDALPDDTMESFNATGTSHIIVISGFNIAILTIIALRILNQWLRRQLAVLVTIAVIAVYTLLVGADASVVRAAIMGGTVLLAVLAGRASNALISLALAASVMTLLDPLTLWDISFQLSAGATLGLILLASPLYQQTHQMLSGSGLSKSTLPLLKDTLIATLAAQVFTLPLILYYFQRLSLVMPLANILVLPVQPPLMGSGAIALVAGWLWLPAGRIVGAVAWLFLTYTIRVVELLASVPFASVEIGDFPEALLWGYYAAILTILWVSGMDAEKRELLWQTATQYMSTKAVLSTLVLACLLIWAVAFSLPDGLLHVRFLDVGQGDASLITLPDGQQVLLDGGPSPSNLLSELGRAMPFWDRKIELVILSHPDMDHLTGLVALLERYQVDQVLDPAVAEDSALYSQWRESLEAKGVPVQTAHAYMRIELGPGIFMDVLHPQADESALETADVNNRSTVLKLNYGEASFLFAGDLEDEGEEILLQSGQNIDSTVLKVSHHGAPETTTEHFVQAVSPQLAVVSVGPNKFGHPAEETLAKLNNIPLLRTDTMGTIDVQCDGLTCWSNAYARSER